MASMNSTFITYGVEYSAEVGNEYLMFYYQEPNGTTIYSKKVLEQLL
jgi:hypothetical protein